MKVACSISGLPRHVESGYNQFWKPIIEKYNADVYLHFWEDCDFDNVLRFYNPIKYNSLSLFKLKNILRNTELGYFSTKCNPFRQFAMFYGWQSACNLITHDYDYIIRGRYDLSGHVNLENMDKNYINVYNYHWWSFTQDVIDDNLYVSNSDLYKKIYSNIFDILLSYSLKFGVTYSPEVHFSRIIREKDLYNIVIKQTDYNLKFKTI